MSVGTEILGVENSLSLIRGASKTFQLTVDDPEAASAGEAAPPADLTGARIILTVKKCVSDSDVVIRKDSENGVAEVSITNPKGGIAEIYFSPTDTQKVDPGEYVFDIWIILASGGRYPVVGPASFNIEAGVTVLA